jgi:hypothetical protein
MPIFWLSIASLLFLLIFGFPPRIAINEDGNINHIVHKINYKINGDEFWITQLDKIDTKICNKERKIGYWLRDLESSKERREKELELAKSLSIDGKVIHSKIEIGALELENKAAIMRLEVVYLELNESSNKEILDYISPLKMKRQLILEKYLPKLSYCPQNDPLGILEGNENCLTSECDPAGIL